MHRKTYPTTQMDLRRTLEISLFRSPLHCYSSYFLREEEYQPYLPTNIFRVALKSPAIKRVNNECDRNLASISSTNATC